MFCVITDLSDSFTQWRSLRQIRKLCNQYSMLSTAAHGFFCVITDFSDFSDSFAQWRSLRQLRIIRNQYSLLPTAAHGCFVCLRISLISLILLLNGVASDNSENSVINIQCIPLKHADFYVITDLSDLSDSFTQWRSLRQLRIIRNQYSMHPTEACGFLCDYGFL